MTLQPKLVTKVSFLQHGRLVLHAQFTQLSGTIFWLEIKDLFKIYRYH